MSTVVVGGGISGLSMAYALSRRGEEVTLLEASERFGGNIRSVREDGFLCETGPNGFLENEPATLELVNQLGLTPRLRRAAPTVKRRFVFSRGALHEVPANPAAIFSSQVLPLAGRLRLLAEPLTRRPPPDTDETLASFARRHLGDAATETLIDAVQAGIFAGDPERLSVSAVFPKMVELEKRHRSLVVGALRSRKTKSATGVGSALCTFDEGLQVLIDALVTELGDRARLNAKVERVATEDGRWRVESSAGRFEADRLVISTPAYLAAELLRPLDPALGGELEQIRYAAMTVVHLGFRSDELPRNLQGFGFLVPEREQRKILGAIFVSSVFPWRVRRDETLLTVMVGGARHPEHAALPDETLVPLVCDELAAVMGLRDKPDFVKVVRWPRAIPQYEVGHLARVGRLQDALWRFPRLFLAGNAYRGVGINDCVRNAKSLAEQIVAS